MKAKAYLNLIADKQNGKHVNSKDIRKHRSDVLKNVVIIEDAMVEAPEAIVGCINEFVSSIRDNWDELSDSLAASIGQDKEFVSELLNQLNELFVIKP